MRERIQSIRAETDGYKAETTKCQLLNEVLMARKERLDHASKLVEDSLNTVKTEQQKLQLDEFETLYVDIFDKDPIGRLFAKHDVNKNQRLDTAEAIKAMEELVGARAHDYMNKFSEFDADGDGDLDLQEFTTLYHTLLETPTVLEAAYKQEGLTPADTLTAPPPKPTVEA